MQYKNPAHLAHDDEMVPDKVAAQLLGLSNPKVLANWRYQKRNPDLKYVKFGRTVRYRVGDVRAFCASHTVHRNPNP